MLVTKQKLMDTTGQTQLAQRPRHVQLVVQQKAQPSVTHTITLATQTVTHVEQQEKLVNTHTITLATQHVIFVEQQEQLNTRLVLKQIVKMHRHVQYVEQKSLLLSVTHPVLKQHVQLLKHVQHVEQNLLELVDTTLLTLKVSPLTV